MVDNIPIRDAYGPIGVVRPSPTCPLPNSQFDVSTLVSGRVHTSLSTRGPSSHIPCTTSTTIVFLELESHLEVSLTTRTWSPAPTSTAASTIDGVRISS